MNNRTLTRTLIPAAVAAWLASCSSAAAQTQPAPPGPVNLQILPKDTARAAVIQRMRGFSLALGVRCQYCHFGGDGVSMDGVVFESDQKATKQKARAMMRLVETLNTTLLPQVPSRSQPAVRVDCVTCHRGLPVPKTLETVLSETIASAGAAAAVQQYRDLRSHEALTGRYDFGEWSVNELARTLAENGNVDAAIAMLEMNGEYYPTSAAIDVQLGDLFLKHGERDKALARFRSALHKDPTNDRLKQRIAELEGRQ